MAIAALPEGTLLAQGRYRLTGVLARSGFSVTYHARDLRAGGAEVVVKEHACSDACFRDTSTWQVLPHPGQERLHRQLIDRVTREARLLGEVRHPNVVRVDGAWEERGTAYCAMELVPGRTLDDEVQLGAELPLDEPRWRRVRAIALEVLAALEAAHARGVYHCDLKPDNVLVCPPRGAVLIDFGAARTEGQLLGTVTLMPFTPGYAPPELLSADRIPEVGPWTDAYSWGMLVFGLALGHAGRGIPLDASGRLLRRSWPSIADRDPYEDAAEALIQRGMPEPWAEAIHACVRLDPLARPASMAALAKRLGEAASLTPSAAAPMVVSAPAPVPAPLPPTLPPPPDEPTYAPRPSRIELPPPPAPARVSRPLLRGRRAPLFIAAAALLLGGAIGTLLIRGDRADAPASSLSLLPPLEIVAADPPPSQPEAMPANEANEARDTRDMRDITDTSDAGEVAGGAPPCGEGRFACAGACQRTADPTFGCGHCRPCRLDHASDYKCTGGQCDFKRCDPGWGDCDRKPANGCEVNLRQDPAHCGVCGDDCAGAFGPGVAAVCIAGQCRPSAAEPPPLPRPDPFPGNRGLLE